MKLAFTHGHSKKGAHHWHLPSWHLTDVAWKPEVSAEKFMSYITVPFIMLLSLAPIMGMIYLMLIPLVVMFVMAVVTLSWLFGGMLGDLVRK